MDIISGILLQMTTPEPRGRDDTRETDPFDGLLREAARLPSRRRRNGGNATGITLNVVIGLALFFLGMYINHGTDTRLIAIRKEKEGYQIPQGWLFRWISCPNHFGEIVEWTGFALIAWSVPALTFAIWTFCNLAPRALNHHAWYHENFKEYPKNRKAFIPWGW